MRPIEPAIATALAWLGALYVTLLIAVVALFLASEVWARVNAWRSRMTTAEVDPIESCPPTPMNCQQEPPYPRHRTVVFSIRNPDMVAHLRTWRCPVEYPHLIAHCREFAAVHPLTNAREPSSEIVS